MIPDLKHKPITPHPTWAPSIREVGGVCMYCQSYLSRVGGRECPTLLRVLLNKALEQEPMITDSLVKELKKYVENFK